MLSACVWALSAETEERSKYLFMPRAHWKLMRNRGVLAPLINPTDAANYPYSSSDQDFINDLCEHALIGSPDIVAKQLCSLANNNAIDEIVILTWTYDEKDRRRSYELLAKELIA